MSTSNHEMTKEVPFKFRPTGFDGFEVAYPKVRIEFIYQGGRAGSYEPGGSDPPEGADITVVSATMIEGDGLGDVPADILLDRVQDWIDGDGYEVACAFAENER